METRMFFRILKRSFFGFILFLSVQIQGQEKDNGTLTATSGENTDKDTVGTFTTESDWLPTTSLYIELGGRVLYSIKERFDFPCRIYSIYRHTYVRG
jgi:hypothetical protein